MSIFSDLKKLQLSEWSEQCTIVKDWDFDFEAEYFGNNQTNVKMDQAPELLCYSLKGLL